MAKPEDAAKKYLQGLSGDKPWETPIGGGPKKPMPKKADPPKSEPADEIGDQVYRIAERNRKFAERTKGLRKD